MSTAVGLAILVSLVVLEGIAGSSCPKSEGFFSLGGSSQCFRHYGEPKRTWVEARAWCVRQHMKLAQPNDDVLGELSTHLDDNYYSYYPAWLGARWSDSTSGFLWDGEQHGISIGRHGLDGHPGWEDGEPGSWVGNDFCLLMMTDRGSTPYVSNNCSQQMSTLCQQ